MTRPAQVPQAGESPQYSPLPPEVKRPWPTTVLWRWRYELLGVLGISMGGLFAYRAHHLAATALITAVLAVVVGAIPPLRRAASGRILCVVVQHRLRTGLANAWVHNRYGRLPAILRTRPTPYGEAVTLWCPAGVGERQISAAAAVLRDACWGARHVQVTADPRRRHLVTVHVIRRLGDDMQHG